LVFAYAPARALDVDDHGLVEQPIRMAAATTGSPNSSPQGIAGSPPASFQQSASDEPLGHDAAYMGAEDANLLARVALVGVALAPGAAPADGLAAGDLVRVVRLPVTPEEISQDGGGRLVLSAVPVWAARPGKDGATVITLRVAVEYADHIAGLSAHGAVALERVTAPS
jgi:hypothetical protein